MASLIALRGLPVPLDMRAADRDQIRALYTTPVTEVTHVSRPWTRKGRKFVQVSVEVADIRRLHEAPPFAWATYSLEPEGELTVYRQVVGASAMKPGSLKNYGWDGSEIVAFRLHLPSEIVYHNARDLETNATTTPARGNILAWEQHLPDRLDGKPVEIEVRMESTSILYTTLWLFAGSFAAALLGLALFIWWFVRRGREEPTAPERP
jgi:hypothetical protein